jgi:hypothetical protein
MPRAERPSIYVGKGIHPMNRTRRLILTAFTSALLLAPLAASYPADRQNHVAVFPIRECYCPAHFGNSYEAMGPREMAAYLAEMKWMRFNRYGDWITTTDVCCPYTSDATWDLAKEQLDRKKKAFRAAQDLGLGLNLIVTPNHVYLDQLRPHYAATKTKKIFGQLVCPSHPEARKLILENFERWFDDLADAGLRFSAFTAFAYDYGGCDCEKCRPWILTFARLMKDIHAIAQRRHPGIEPWLCSWWWTPEEHAQFNDWAAKEAPGWLKAMTMHIEYGQTHPKDVAVPAGCRKAAFVHIGYGDQPDREVYGRLGAVVAPHRLPETLRELHQRGFEGFQAYSEGVLDDCNKMLLAGIGSGRFTGADDALRAYAQRYLAASPERAADWAKWLAQWGDRRKVPLPAAAEELASLSDIVKPTWRVEHWRCKVELETLDRAIGNPKAIEWTPAKLALVDQYFAAQERLYREVYRLGPVRHVLNPRFMPPPWYESWRKANSQSAGPTALLPQQ